MIDVIDAAPSDDGDWIKVDSDGIKSHYVHKCNLSNLLLDFQLRKFDIRNTEATRKAYVEFEMSSFHFVGRPVETIKLDVLDIDVLSRDVGITIEFMKELSLRKFVDKTGYYKLKSSFCCIVLTPDQYSTLLFGLKFIKSNADERDRGFFNIIKNSKTNKTSNY